MTTGTRWSRAARCSRRADRPNPSVPREEFEVVEGAERGRRRVRVALREPALRELVLVQPQYVSAVRRDPQVEVEILHDEFAAPRTAGRVTSQYQPLSVPPPVRTSLTAYHRSRQ